MRVRILSTLCLLVFGFSAAGGLAQTPRAPKPAKPSKAQPKEPGPEQIARARFALAAAYGTLFPSMTDYLAQAVKEGRMLPEDQAEILSFLRAKKIDPASRLVAPKNIQGEMRWKSLTLSFTQDGHLKTDTGRILKFDKDSSASAVFKKTYLELTGEKQASRASLWLPVAEANGLRDALDSISAAAAAAGPYVSRSLWTGIETTTVAAGAVFVPLDWVKYQLRWLIYEGAVECRGSNYVILNYPSYSTIMGQDYEFWKTRPEGWSESLAGASGAAGAAMLSLLGFREGRSASDGVDLVERDPIARRVPDGVLKEVLGGSNGASCTKESARKVEDFMKKKAQALTDEINRNSPPSPALDPMGNPTGHEGTR